jgi:hypothetical protein
MPYTMKTVTAAVVEITGTACQPHDRNVNRFLGLPSI